MTLSTLRCFPLACLLLVVGRALPAQSITAGELVGVVRDTVGDPVNGVRVEIADRETGFRREATTDRSGRFGFRLVPPGDYDLLAEALGYWPTEMRGIRVGSASVTRVDVRIAIAEPPIAERAVVPAPPGGLAGQGGAAWAFEGLELRGLPERRRDAPAVTRYAASADDAFVVEGLPASASVTTIDAVRVTAPMHAEFGAPLANLAFPLSAFRSATLDPANADVEWSGYAGSRLSLHPVRGGRQVLARAWGDWTGAALSRSGDFAPEDLGQNSFRGGLVVSGPITRDTATFVLGFEAQRVEMAVPPAWVGTSLDSALVSTAADSFGVDLGPRLAGRVSAVRAVSGFGRFDWQANANNLLSVFATGASYTTDDPSLGPGRLDARSIAADGNDLAVVATVTSALSGSLGLELRAAFETGRQEYRASDTAATYLTAAPIAFGTDPLLPGRFERTTFRAAESLHLVAGRHRLKLGGGAWFTSYDNTAGVGRVGEFVFSDVDALGSVTGGFTQQVGRSPLARFKTYEFGAWLQDRWQATPGLDLLVGMRLGWERVPVGDISDNAAWQAATGITSDSAKATNLQASPRAALIWDVDDAHRWILRVEGGLYHGDFDPGVMAEALRLVGPIEGRRAVGDLGGWPLAPDSTVAPLRGPILAPLAVGYRAPRTARVSGGLSATLGGGAALHVSGTYRRTESLTRRRDLNLAVGTNGRDQYGRAVYGNLIQLGSALLVEPGSNRRFAEFDEVLSLDFDGYSNYVGLTARLEQRAARFLTLSAGYSYSRTTDNWLGARDGRPGAMLSPFPDSLGGVDWAEGRSDFDIPHRLVLGAELTFPAFRLAGFFRHQSGYPFTPGFREGVDANGDGSFRNDPATVDEAVTGVPDLFAEWDCLRQQVGRTFVERNACRGPTQQTLDLRLVAGPFQIGYPVELVVDALDLLEAKALDVDRALYLVDPNGSVVTDPATGVVTVPLVVNPGFGQPVARYGSGRFLRVGLRVNY